MKFALINDCHILLHLPRSRLDDAIQTSVDKFESVMSWCSKNNLILLIGGDFTDRPRGWYVYKKIIRVFKKYSNVKVYAVFGQHCMFLRNTEATILDLLNQSNYLTILGNKPIIFKKEKIFLYGCSWGGEIPKAESKEDFNILVIHAPIAEAPLFPNHDYQDAKKFLKENMDYDLILCGDIHREFVIKYKNRMIVNTGPMLRLTAEAYSFEHEPNFKVYNTKTREVETIFIPHAPADEVLTREHIERQDEIDSMLDEFVTSMKEDFEVEADLISNIEKYLKENEISDSVVNIISRVMEE
ncbi:hypothetical protein LCGC14_2261830 [marine sediment metagenome]|uniref:Calcineurin-like phosphoesterase domain-containing protein n=1 Tax=marine sediment metagenome TaxID=412755 RepID=A0A0F9DLW8_9ZZZZ